MAPPSMGGPAAFTSTPPTLQIQQGKEEQGRKGSVEESAGLDHLLHSSPPTLLSSTLLLHLLVHFQAQATPANPLPDAIASVGLRKEPALRQKTVITHYINGKANRCIRWKADTSVILHLTIIATG